MNLRTLSKPKVEILLRPVDSIVKFIDDTGFGAHHRKLQKEFTFKYEEDEEVPSTKDPKVKITKTVNKKYFCVVPVEGTLREFKFKTGLYKYIYNFLIAEGLEVVITSELDRFYHRNLDFTVPSDIVGGGIQLREDYQLPALNYNLIYARGINNIPTRGGKTEIIIGIIKSYFEYYNKDAKVTILAKKTGLVDNLIERLQKRGLGEQTTILNMDTVQPEKQIQVCVINTVYNNVVKNTKETPIGKRLLETELLIIDEVQDLGADMFYGSTLAILSTPHCKQFSCFSGTPYFDSITPESNLRDIRVLELTGGVIVTVEDEYLIQKGYKARGNVVWIEPTMRGRQPQMYNFQQVQKKYIINNEARNKAAIGLASKIVASGFKVLILVNRIDHGKILLNYCKDINTTCRFASGTEGLFEMVGGTVTKNKDTSYNVIEDFRTNQGFNLLIGTSIFEVGIDFPGVNWLILLSAGGKDNDVLNKQRTSRVLCPNPIDNNGYIIDFSDQYNRMLKYQALGRNQSYLNSRYNIFYGEGDFTKLLNNSVKLHNERTN
ncbi:helicase [Maribacter phage Molly_5]|uniref:Helicase n=1 Tax=Maribacter phage Molly_1 TaxID=2745685 RepID=A0A8E4UY56_9CAUD|nr:helicase [Maribacter phage Molly_1]QQO97602.1 helicase [Maribacter phage Molly_2]QQO97802.1 helicase [Maribacter phage Molly_3]QQO98003.1 helicase [Maribacter phage Molly_4]QQO98203.1 helicase [Maribacter phage Molly_5]QQO97402.1 helicase [Maribacter phage Molly_1]